MMQKICSETIRTIFVSDSKNGSVVFAYPNFGDSGNFYFIPCVVPQAINDGLHLIIIYSCVFPFPCIVCSIGDSVSQYDPVSVSVWHRLP